MDEKIVVIDSNTKYTYYVPIFNTKKTITNVHTALLGGVDVLIRKESDGHYSMTNLMGFFDKATTRAYMYIHHSDRMYVVEDGQTKSYRLYEI